MLTQKTRAGWMKTTISTSKEEEGRFKDPAQVETLVCLYWEKHENIDKV